MLRFLALSADAEAYYEGLAQKRLNARHHVRKILALAEVYRADSILAPSPMASRSRPLANTAWLSSTR